MIVTGQLTGGTDILNNSTLIVEGGSNSNPSASSAATVVMQSGVNTVDLAHIATTASNNLTIKGLGPSDSIGVGETFTSATFTSTSGPFGATGTVNFSGATGAINASLSNPVFDRTFYPTVATSTIDGTTYTIATLDPGPTGATGHTGGDWSHGSTGAHGSNRSHHRRNRTGLT